MSNKWGKPRKNIKNRRDPRWHSDEYQITEEDQKDFGSNQKNIEKLKQRKVLKEAYGDFNTGSRTSYSDEETLAGVDDDRAPSSEELISDAIMQGWEDTISAVIKEHLPDEEMKLLDDRGGWINLGSYDEDMLELTMKIRDDLLREEDSDYEFTQGFEENRSRNRAEIDE
tara:strand:+ start:70 stop:579 length:510 start_codon:yes stop_codon:yes gene_type:complete